MCQFNLLQRLELFDAVNGGFDIIRHQRGQIFSTEETLQQQDRFDDATGTQHQRFADTRYAVTVGILQGVSRFQQAMSIGVGFHHGNQAALRRQATDLLQVMSQGAAIDDSSCRFHFNSLADYSSSYCGPA
ncbi:hypothetical protein D3C80_1746520 [compost metagenome]